MASSVNIRFSCGCGYRTDKLEEAIKHASERKHSLTVQGTVAKRS